MTKAELVDQVAATVQPKAPDGRGDHAVLAGDYGCAAYRGECGIAGLWAFPAPPPPVACWTQPTHGGHGPDSGQNDPCIYRWKSLSSAGANRCRNFRQRRRRCYPQAADVLVGHARRYEASRSRGGHDAGLQLAPLRPPPSQPAPV